MKRLALLNLLLLVISQVSGQVSLEINGYIEKPNGKSIEGATVEIYTGSKKEKSVQTNSKGLFIVNLDYGKEYKVIVSKKGMIRKRIDFNTNVPADDQRKLVKEFVMTLIKGCEGANTSILDEPVDIIEYNAGFGNFLSNQTYYKSMQSKIAQAYQSIEKCTKDRFQRKKDEAVKAYKEGKLEEAKDMFEEALEIIPGDSYAKRQIVQINKDIEKRKINEKRYKQLIAEADAFYSQQKLPAAKQRYLEAIRIKADEVYPKQKLEEINGILSTQEEAKRQEQETNNNYNNLISSANTAMTSQNYDLARQLFEQAAAIKPADAFSIQKIAEAQEAIEKVEQKNKEREENLKAYQESIVLGQEAMKKGNYAQAQQHFQKAITHNPSDTKARQMIVEVQKLEAQKKEEEYKMQKAEVERKYKEAIQKAEGLLSQTQYDESISAYKEALVVKPSDEYALNQITKVKNLKVEVEQEKLVATENAYRKAIETGDKNKLNGAYEAAISSYERAFEIKPDDPVAQAKIEEAKSLLSDKKLKDKEEFENRAKYKQLIQEADGLFLAGKYAESKVKYEQALSAYPMESYPKNKIATIENILAKNEKENEFLKLVSEADKLYTQQNYEQAIQVYNSAKMVIPGKKYPLQRINEINQILIGKAKAEVVEKYNELVAQAEQQIKQKNFEQAKALYNSASSVMPDNPYPQQRINEINTMISEQLRLKDYQKYNGIIGKADGLFGQGQYSAAKRIYNQALAEKPEEHYPQQKINEINSILIDLEKQEKDKEEVQRRYDEAVALADRHFSANSLALARNEYTRAMGIIPNQNYPKTQLDKIADMLASQQQAEAERSEIKRKYAEAIARADELFRENMYQESKPYYQKAIELVPQDVHASSQLKRIDELIVKKDSEEKRKNGVEEKYKSILANADSKFGGHDYKEARKLYLAALEVKPNEQYPRAQIRKTDERLRILSSNQQKVNDTKNSGTSSMITKPTFRTESERKKYFDDLLKKYSPGVTLELYKEGNKTTKRYIVIRDNQAHEFLAETYSWGGAQFSVDGKPSNAIYFNQQVKPRSGEKFIEIKK